LAAATLSKPKPKLPAAPPPREGGSKEHTNHSQESVNLSRPDDVVKVKQSLEAYKLKRAKQNEMLQQQQQQSLQQQQHRHASKRSLPGADELKSKKLKELPSHHTSPSEALKKEQYKRHLLKQQQQQQQVMVSHLPPLPPPLPKGSSGNSPPPPPPPLR